ncbi:hypothetical protein SAMD00019534_064310 [Acytostelium subglobosum LB1]|uniref:hypothetical protein n=1 Tax=Acytostelium subglobosum LB1 TaxID=1410327 RepID=UPI000644BEBC|nr:hypothetical protein SAMD00019534_064310 [Acytostelium subglobosum LB1]GAM23256.1 hypothetical protein SAMD00019534_064310 [Acytostelium subglobosum LB1]|eukprot:XP_012753705.1 hypothetical protein SAMD00019534_064310 [Acytostelium subglobosum LB1]
MNSKIINIAILLVIFSAVLVHSANLNAYPFDLTQTKTATWSDGTNNVFSTFDCHLINLSGNTVTLTSITANSAPVSVWGALSPSETTTFAVQEWASSISPNGTVSFGYLVQSSNAISWTYSSSA